MRTQTIMGLVGAAALGAASTAGAQTWKEQPTAAAGQVNHTGSTASTDGDAGETLASANITNGSGALTTITGTLAAIQRPQPDLSTLRSLDADIYAINITLPTQFTATTNTGDTVLALFDWQGRGVAFNDNRTDSTTALQSRLAGIPGLTEGTYYLAISRNAGNASSRNFSRPLDALGNLIFPGPAQFTDDSAANLAARRADVGPTDPNATLASWEMVSSLALPFNSNYSIALTGTSYTVPAPGAGALLGLAALGLGRRRR